MKNRRSKTRYLEIETPKKIYLAYYIYYINISTVNVRINIVEKKKMFISPLIYRTNIRIAFDLRFSADISTLSGNTRIYDRSVHCGVSL